MTLHRNLPELALEIARQMRAEAQLHTVVRFGVLSARATLLERSLNSHDPDLLPLVLREAIDALVVAIIQRTERELAKGDPR